METVEGYSLALPYPPSANRFMRHIVIAGRPRTLLTKEARAYKHGVGLQCAAQGVKPIIGGVTIEVDVYRPRRSGDLDNTLKVLLDSLKGYVYADDAQIVEIRARRFEDKDRPRVEVTAFPASKP